MIKRSLLFACVAILAVGASALFFSFRADTSSPDFVGHPVHWESPSALILMRGRALVRRHLDTGDEEIIFDLQTLGDTALGDLDPVYACFTDAKWRIPYYRKKDTGFSLQGYLIYSGKSSEVSVEPFASNLITNGPACGEPYQVNRKGEGAPVLIPNPKPDQNDITAEHNPTLFEPSEAQHVLIGADFGSLSIVYSTGNETKHVVLQGAQVSSTEKNSFERFNGRWRKEDSPLSIRDAYSGKYMLHQPPRPLSKRVWVVSLNQAKAEAIDLPVGPWAAENSESLFSCGSCGCGCYRQQKFYYAGEKIFIHIWGSQYSEDVQGIFQLVRAPDGASWSHKVKGGLKIPIVFSPDGCRVAVVRNDVEIREVCK